MEFLDLPSEILVIICHFLPPAFVYHKLRHVNKLFWNLIQEHFKFANHLKLSANTSGPWTSYLNYGPNRRQGNKEEDFLLLKYDDDLVKFRSYLQNNRLDLLTLSLSINIMQHVDDNRQVRVNLDFNSPAKELAQIFPRLTSLTALRVDMNGSLHATDKHGFKKAMGLLKHLRQLSLSKMTLTIWWALDALESLESLHVENFEELYHIFFACVDAYGKILVEEKPRPFKVLKEFHLQRLDPDDGRGGEFDKYSWFWKHFPSLENFQIEGIGDGLFSGIKKGAVPMIRGLAKHCPHLETFTFKAQVNPANDQVHEVHNENDEDNFPTVDQDAYFPNLKKFKFEFYTETLHEAKEIRKRIRRYRIFKKCCTTLKKRGGAYFLKFADSRVELKPINQVFFTNDFCTGLKSRKSLLDEILGPDRDVHPNLEIIFSDEEEENRMQFQNFMNDSSNRKAPGKRNNPNGGSNSGFNNDENEDPKPGPSKRSKSVK